MRREIGVNILRIASPRKKLVLAAKDTPLQTLTIKSSSHEYPVILERGCLDRIGSHLTRLGVVPAGAACGLITDDVVAPLYADRVKVSLAAAGFRPAVVVIPAGEGSKSLSTVGRIADALISHGLDRQSFLVALGGGVVGDVVGFVASIYYRGIPFVQLPTTIVAQVDSAIGGKTGINTLSGKNLLGSFYPPACVGVDVAALSSLTDRVFTEGFAEVVKHGVIRDAALFEGLFSFRRGDDAALEAIVRRNLEIKAEIVAADEYERLGLRACLNFGHTIGHGIEQAGGYGRYLHGEAVSLGMVAAARLSVRKAGLHPEECAAIIRCLRHFELPTELAADISTDEIIKSLSRDKKFEAGTIRFVLIFHIGEARLSAPGEVTLADIRAAIEGLRSTP